MNVQSMNPSGYEIEKSYSERIGRFCKKLWDEMSLDAIISVAIQAIGRVSQMLALCLDCAWRKISRVFCENRLFYLKEENLNLKKKLEFFEKERFLISAQVDFLSKDTKRITQERNESVTGQARLKFENEKYLEQNQKLQDVVEKLSNEKKGLICEKEACEIKLIKALDEVKVLETQISQDDCQKKVWNRLEQIHHHYQLSLREKAENQRIRCEIPELMSLLQKQKRQYCEELKISLERLPEKDHRRIYLNGLLRIADRELEYFEWLTEALIFYSKIQDIFSVVNNNFFMSTASNGG